MMWGMVSGETGAAVRNVLAVLTAVAVGLGLAAFLDNENPAPVAAPIETTNREPSSVDIDWVDVAKTDDIGKAGTARTVMVQRFLGVDERVCGRSGDQLRVRFDSPVQVTGIDISVDIGGTLGLVEVMAAANGTRGYGSERSADPLAHTSWVAERGGVRSIDKVTVLPEPVSLAAGGHVTIGAWLCSIGPTGRVSPEVIVSYRWSS